MAGEKLRIVACRILEYLERNPNAQDTLEGIVEWWLLYRYTKGNVARVKEALEELVTAGLVLGRRGKESRIYYKLNPQKPKEISTFLRTKRSPGDDQSNS
jgi:hypothetical protein